MKQSTTRSAGILPASFAFSTITIATRTPRGARRQRCRRSRWRTALAVALPLWLTAFLPFALHAATTNEEAGLIAVLQTSHSPAEKDAACARLKWIGTARCVPAVAALLTDEQLSHSARYALESMPFPAAGSALIAALDQTSGLTEVGIIQSLGVRREARAVPALAKLLPASEPVVGAASAIALGQIGDSRALRALLAALNNSTGPVHDAVVDGLLRCANGLVASGHPSGAQAVFKRLYDSEKSDRIRVAAYRGLIRASGQDGLTLMTQAITGAPGPSQTAAVQLVHDLEVSGATKALADLLPKLPPRLQVALIGGLAQRADPAAASQIIEQARSTVPEVRLAALKALAILGDASVVPLLCQFAASDRADEQTAARQALVQLRRGKVTEGLLAQLSTAAPGVQAEAARALGERSDKTAVPSLLELARLENDSARKAALGALAGLVIESQLASLIQLVLDARDQTARAEMAEAVNTAFQRLQTRRGKVDAEPLVKALAAGSADARVALLPVCSGLPNPAVRAALRAALQDADPQVRAAAIRALCDTSDTALLDDLLEVVRRAPEENFRALAIGGCVRLLAPDEANRFSNPQRIAAFKAILATALRPEQKRLVFAGLAEVAMPEALELVEPSLTDAAVQNEAAAAVVKIAAALPLAEAKTAIAALTRAAAATTDPAIRRAAEASLKEIRTNAAYITTWQVAGPYLQEGKDYAALFDIVFPPERPGASDVTWRALPAGVDPKQPWVMDLLKALGGEQRVAYARTWVHCDQETPVRLELGSDDGVKVWLNDKVVHANNTFRGLQPGSDKVNVTLNKGWNSLLLKVTQLNAGWAFCARFLQPDGSPVEGLQFDASPPNPASTAQ